MTSPMERRWRVEEIRRRQRQERLGEPDVPDIMELDQRLIRRSIEADRDIAGAEEDHQEAMDRLREIRSRVTRTRDGRERTPSPAGAAELRDAEATAESAWDLVQKARARAHEVQDALDMLWGRGDHRPMPEP